jgi:putative transposase
MNKERYRRGAHKITDFKYHFVWKTKYGYNVLKKDLALRLRDIVRKICSEHRMEIIKGNVRSNHIHILMSAPAHLSLAKIIQYLKGKSSYRFIVYKESFLSCVRRIGAAIYGHVDILVPQ